MSGSIFVLHSNNELVELKHERYENEDIFQSLIEKYPSILAGEQINPENPRQWIFISREMGIPSEPDGGSQWYLDHLFLDQDAIPTFIEVKRSTDTRVRREVVAQMLDYAANATAYWPIDLIRTAYEENAKNGTTKLLADIGIEIDKEDSYWHNVATNLKSGKIRLLFVADEIPMSLQRIIEFLNNQMVDTEVLGLEIKQYVADTGLKTLVPHIIGRTASSVQTKRQEKGVWDEESFLEDVRHSSGDAAVTFCQNLLRSFELMGCTILWGQGKTHGSFTPVYEGKQKHAMITVYPWTKSTLIEIYFKWFKPPFSSHEKRVYIKKRLEEIKGVKIPDNRLDKRPNIDWSLLAASSEYEKFIKIFSDYVEEVKKYEATT